MKLKVLETLPRNRTKWVCFSLGIPHEFAQHFDTLEDAFQVFPIVHGHYCMLPKHNYPKAVLTRNPIDGAISEIFHNIPLPQEYYLDPEVITPRILQRYEQQNEMIKGASLVVDYEEVGERIGELCDFFERRLVKIPFHPGRTPMPTNYEDICQHVKSLM